MSNIYLYTSYCEKLTFSKLDFSRVKYSYPGQLLRRILTQADIIEF